jgi:hypothetical membrane protein
MINIAKSISNEKVFLSISGILLFLAGVLLFMGIITAEIYYTEDFNTRDNYISELAAPLPPNTVVLPLPAAIFNNSMIAAGIMILLASLFIQSAFKRLLASIPLGLFGLGFLGVGIFPGDVVPWHGLSAMVLFIFGGVSAITSFRIVSSPLNIIFILLGITALVFLVAYKIFIPAMGVGGAERWVLYPEVFWITGLGGYLLGVKNQKRLY